MPIMNDVILYDEEFHGDGLKKAFLMLPQDVVLEVRESGLKGRGGAGFPTGTKWMIAMNAISDKKYVV